MKANTGRAKLLIKIYQLYGTQFFLTDDLYKLHSYFGLNENSIGATISSLGKDGFLEKTQGTRTSNDRIQKQWCLTRKGIVTVEQMMG